TPRRPLTSRPVRHKHHHHRRVHRVSRAVRHRPRVPLWHAVVHVEHPAHGPFYTKGALVKPPRNVTPPRRGHMAPMPIPAGLNGWSPQDLWSAYALLAPQRGFGKTVAIIDAYDNPNVESDLAAYRSHYELPPCTTANGCFRKIAQDGSTNYPAPAPA